MKTYEILMVDDEESIRTVLKLDLEKKNYWTDGAETGSEALKKLENHHFDLIILDLKMEEMDGLELMRRIKKIEPELLVIMLTGYASLDSAVEAMRLGASDYLRKPYDKSDLYLRVSKCFETLELNKKVQLYEKVLTVCCMCGQFQDNTGKEPGEGEWMKPEVYLSRRANVESSHTYCTECFTIAKQEIEEFGNGQENS